MATIIKKPNQHFDATTYTGTGSTNTITNAGGFQPDLVWVKNRTTAGAEHELIDSVRGSTKGLQSSTTAAEVTDANFPTITSTGFTVGASSYTNQNGASLVAWQWKAGGASTVNASGTISSNVSVNTTAGFSIMTYTGTGSNGTVGHGLSTAPKMVIVKSRGNGGNEWCVWHTSLTNATYYLYLNGTSAQAVATTFWNSTAPTSSVISLGTDVRTNRSSGNFVCYAFAEIGRAHV